MIRIGVAGWSYADWQGRVYPKHKPKGFHPLSYLARYVDCMEINSTFYALPRAEYAANWVDLVETSPDFIFTAKLLGAFTHGPLDGITPELARLFQAGLAPLADAGRLHALLVQFPAFFRAGPKGWERLGRIRDLFPDERLVLELRHRSWFHAESYGRLAASGFGLAHIDLPAARDHPPTDHPSVGDTGYLRLHGRNRETWFDPKAGRDDRYDYRYGRTELVAVAERMRSVAQRTERQLLITNNHFGGQAVANALELKGLLGADKPSAPQCLLEAFPDLRQYVRAEGQLPLW